MSKRRGAQAPISRPGVVFTPEQKKAIAELEAAAAVAPAAPAATATGSVEFRIVYDAVRDTIPVIETNLEGGRIDVMLLARVIAQLNKQTLLTLTMQRDELAREVNALKGGSNGKG